jgi:hypothetical protein
MIFTTHGTFLDIDESQLVTNTTDFRFYSNMDRLLMRLKLRGTSCAVWNIQVYEISRRMGLCVATRASTYKLRFIN